MESVGSIQVEGPHLATKGQQHQEEGSPAQRGTRRGGDSVPMSHRGCHSKVQVLQQSKFRSRRALWELTDLKEEIKRQILCKVSSSSLSSVDDSLLSSPLSLSPSLALCRGAGSQPRLLLSVWAAGCENVAAMCVRECVSLNACAPPPLLYVQRETEDKCLE